MKINRRNGAAPAGRVRVSAALAALALLATAPVAWADDAGQDGAGQDGDAPLMARDTLTGNWGGLRQRLAAQGVTVNLAYLAEGFGNVSGGPKHDTAYFGRADLQIDADLARLAGWRGASFHLGAYQLSGHGLSTRTLKNIMPVSNAEATPATRLFTLWLEQKLLDDRLSVRAGQLAADDEFVTSPTAGTLINGTFGWLALAASNLPSGGPAYPLATPGVRVEVDPAPQAAVLFAVFSGDPAARPGAEDPQRQDHNGLTFSRRGGAFLIGEAQWKRNQGKDAAGLPGVYKIGGWYHSGTFDDLDTDDRGGSLAAATSSGVARRHHGNYGVYAVADQMVWRQPGSDTAGLNLFLRLGAAPGDRNLVNFYADSGLGYTGLIPGREADSLALGIAYARIGSGARDFDRDTAALSATPGPERSYEAVMELTYRAEVAPWLHVQPDLQYIVNPGGHAANPADPTGRSAEPDAVVLGLRTVMAF